MAYGKGEYISLVLWKGFTFPLLSKEKKTLPGLYFSLSIAQPPWENPYDEIFNKQKTPYKYQLC